LNSKTELGNVAINSSTVAGTGPILLQSINQEKVTVRMAKHHLMLWLKRKCQRHPTTSTTYACTYQMS